MDEATANIDQHTDFLIQDVVRTSFKGKTVIMVAHRLNTVIDCDQVRFTPATATSSMPKHHAQSTKHACEHRRGSRKLAGLVRVSHPLSFSPIRVRRRSFITPL